MEKRKANLKAWQDLLLEIRIAKLDAGEDRTHAINVIRHEIEKLLGGFWKK